MLTRFILNHIQRFQDRISNHSSNTPRVSMHLLQFFIGIVCLLLPITFIISTYLDCGQVLGSISAYYHTLLRDLFVGLLFAMGALMMAYKGYHAIDQVVSTLAGVAAFLVAVFPVEVKDAEKSIACMSQDDFLFCNDVIHYAAAMVVFVSMTFMTLILFPLGRDSWRNIVYHTSGLLMLLCLCALLLITLNMEAEWVAYIEGFQAFFWLESIVLFCFAVSWLTKSKYYGPTVSEE
jgi:hypothetical protein